MEMQKTLRHIRVSTELAAADNLIILFFSPSIVIDLEFLAKLFTLAPCICSTVYIAADMNNTILLSRRGYAYTHLANHMHSTCSKNLTTTKALAKDSKQTRQTTTVLVSHATPFTM